MVCTDWETEALGKELQRRKGCRTRDIFPGVHSSLSHFVSPGPDLSNAH